jgi:hypothetical protein
MNIDPFDNGSWTSLRLNQDDYVEARKRIKHAREVAKLNPNKMFSDTEAAYMIYCSDFLIPLIDNHRTQKAECLCFEREYFSTFVRDVISDRPYLLVSNALKIAKRKQHNDAYRAKK